MSLFSNWQQSPKIVENGRDVRYSTEPVMWNSSDNAVSMIMYWKVTRICSMSWKYVGLTKSASEECVNALNRDLTRRYLRWTVSEVENDGSQPPTVLINRTDVIERTASVQPNHAYGDAWEVNVTTNDIDEIVSTEELTTIDQFESLFQLAEQRDVIPESGSVAITEAHWESKSDVVSVNYNAVISNFDVTKVGIEVKDPDAGTWSSVQTITSSRRNGFVQFYSYSNVELRVVYDNSIRSKSYLTMDPEMPDLVAMNAQQTSRFNEIFGGTYQPVTVLTVTMNISDLGEEICRVPSAFTIVYKNKAGGWSTIKPQYARNVGDGKWAYESFPIYYDFNFSDPKVYVTYDLRRINSTTVAVKSKDYLILDDPHYVSCVAGASYSTITFEADFHSDFTSAELNALEVYLKKPAYNAVETVATIVSKTLVSGDKWHLVFSFSEKKDEKNVGGIVWLSCVKTGTSAITSNACDASVELPNLEITSIEPFMTTGSRAYYAFRYESIQLDKTKLHLWKYTNEMRTQIASAFSEVNVVTENDGYINSNAAPGPFKLEYRHSADASGWSDVKAPEGSRFFDFKTFVKLGDGRFRVEYMTNATFVGPIWIGYYLDGVAHRLAIDSSTVTDTGFICEGIPNPGGNVGFFMNVEVQTTGSATQQIYSSCLLPEEE